jgi:hypothetical protein
MGQMFHAGVNAITEDQEYVRRRSGKHKDYQERRNAPASDLTSDRLMYTGGAVPGC